MSHHVSVNFTMSDGSVRALAQLALPFRAAGGAGGAGSAGGVGITATARGPQVPPLAAALAGLRRLGVAVGLPRLQQPWSRLPMLMLQAPSGAALLLVAAGDETPPTLPLPAVQHLREGAMRLRPPASASAPLELVLVQRQPGAAASQPHEQMALNFTHIRID
jgi:hypothetical protein